MNIKIIVAAHKKYDFVKDSMYMPVHVGCEGKEDFGITGDNTGENISSKNSSFCELTGLYWAWKNLEMDYIGLVHYRRYFKGKTRTIFKITKKDKTIEKQIGILSREEMETMLKEVDIIVPEKRNYFIETIYSHYSNTLNSKDLDITRDIIIEKYPEYILDYDNVMNSKKAHMFNMFIMKKDKFDAYCTWLFEVLDELEKRLNTDKYTDFQKRLYGRVSEILLDVWLEKNNYSYKEVAVVNVEGENWIKKGKAFLSAKFLKKKYEKSF